VNWGHGQGRVRVVVAHRRELFAEALGRLLGDLGLVVVAAACEASVLLEYLPEAQADVLVLDAGFDPVRGPLGALHAVRQVAPDVRIVVLTETLDEALGVAVHEGEIDGVVLTNRAGGELASAIAQVVAGHAVLPAGWLGRARQLAASAPLAQLSPRQREVLELLALGMDNEQIASRLFISRNTVKFHVRTIYERLGVHNRVEAARVLAGADIPSAA
jgi:DNA-binding NarL/FixJ family response regulator